MAQRAQQALLPSIKVVMRAGGLVGGGQGRLPARSCSGGCGTTSTAFARGVKEAEGKASTAVANLANQLRLIIEAVQLQQRCNGRLWV